MNACTRLTHIIVSGWITFTMNFPPDPESGDLPVRGGGFETSDPGID